MTFPLNQNRADFKTWLESLPPEEEAIAGDCNECWLAKWFESQGFYVWGVFPTYQSKYPNSVVIKDPNEQHFKAEDKIQLEDWAFLFGSTFDEKYEHGDYICNRDQALELLGAIA